MCNALVNEESVRILYKNNYSFGVKIQNIYMVGGLFSLTSASVFHLLTYPSKGLRRYQLGQPGLHGR